MTKSINNDERLYLVEDPQSSMAQCTTVRPRLVDTKATGTGDGTSGGGGIGTSTVTSTGVGVGYTHVLQTGQGRLHLQHGHSDVPLDDREKTIVG